MAEFILSDSGGKVYTSPQFHPLLKQTDLEHDDVSRKLRRDVYRRGIVKGMSYLNSENSEDACTWFYFSSWLRDKKRRRRELQSLLKKAFPSIDNKILNRSGDAEISFWPKLSPPPTRPWPIREGPSEPDLMVELGKEALVLVEAKYKSGISSKTTYDPRRDQIIRLIDVGSWHARSKGVGQIYVIALQYGVGHRNVEEFVRRYAGKPDAIKEALPYRTDLKKKDFENLSRSVAFVRCPDPYPAGG